MPGTTWAAIGRDARGLKGFVIDGDAVSDEIRAGTVDDILTKSLIGAERIVRIGEGESSKVPCSVLPDAGGHVPVASQDVPADILGAWVRIWIAGFLARREHWDGVICVEEADVSHWVHVSADEIVSFQSYLTPRLITSLGGAATADIEALAETQSRPERLAAHLRQAEVSGHPEAISGHLIGAELASARVYWLGQQVAVLAPSESASIYAAVLEAQGVPVTSHQTEDLIQDGLRALGAAMRLTG